MFFKRYVFQRASSIKQRGVCLEGIKFKTKFANFGESVVNLLMLLLIGWCVVNSEIYECSADMFVRFGGSLKVVGALCIDILKLCSGIGLL